MSWKSLRKCKAWHEDSVLHVQTKTSGMLMAAQGVTDASSLWLLFCRLQTYLAVRGLVNGEYGSICTHEARDFVLSAVGYYRNMDEVVNWHLATASEMASTLMSLCSNFDDVDATFVVWFYAFTDALISFAGVIVCYVPKYRTYSFNWRTILMYLRLQWLLYYFLVLCVVLVPLSLSLSVSPLTSLSAFSCHENGNHDPNSYTNTIYSQ